jgi:hypothetical protein
MQLIRRTGTHWPVEPCTACTRTIQPTEEAMLLRTHDKLPIILCQQCGQAIATESDPTRLIQYLDLFPQAAATPPTTAH